MSFILQTIELPLWFMLFIFASASPVWIRWSKKAYKKFLQRGWLTEEALSPSFEMDEPVFEPVEPEIDAAEKETEENTKQNRKTRKSMTKKKVDPQKKENVRLVLKMLVARGELGALPRAISDETGINPIETKNALEYIMSKEYAEKIFSPAGEKYFLTDLGRRYCINKRYISK